jgi:hypothetical protein
MMAAPNDVASLGTGEGDAGPGGSIRDPKSDLAEVGLSANDPKRTFENVAIAEI